MGGPFPQCSSQRVFVNGEASHCAAVTSGVSQGSVLGLFVMYLNDFFFKIYCCYVMNTKISSENLRHTYAHIHAVYTHTHTHTHTRTHTHTHTHTNIYTFDA